MDQQNIKQDHINQNTLLEQAHHNMTAHNYRAAIELFEQFSVYEINLNALLWLARCYQYVGEFEAAIACYKKIPEWDNSQQVLLHLARAYEEMAKRAQPIEKEPLMLNALNTYMQIRNWNMDRKVLLSLAPCYRAMNLLEHALYTYRRIPQSRNLRQNNAIQNIIKNLEYNLDIQRPRIHISDSAFILPEPDPIEQVTQQAHHYYNGGEYSFAAVMFGKLHRLTNDIQMLLNQADCYQLTAQYDNALTIYEQIPDQIKDQYTFVNQALAYEAVENYVKAAWFFQLIYHYTQDVEALTAMDRCQQKQEYVSVTSHSMFRMNASPYDGSIQPTIETRCDNTSA